jgi:hypothetical protein
MAGCMRKCEKDFPASLVPPYIARDKGKRFALKSRERSLKPFPTPLYKPYLNRSRRWTRPLNSKTTLADVDIHAKVRSQAPRASRMQYAETLFLFEMGCAMDAEEK